jgi:hypothetical protein
VIAYSPVEINSYRTTRRNNREHSSFHTHNRILRFGIASSCSVRRILSCCISCQMSRYMKRQSQHSFTCLFFNVTHYLGENIKYNFSKNEMPCKIFGPKMGDVIEHLRILNNAERLIYILHLIFLWKLNHNGYEMQALTPQCLHTHEFNPFLSHCAL